MELMVGGNKLTGSIPSIIGLLNNLMIVSMYNNNFIGRIPESFCSAPLDQFDMANIGNVCHPGNKYF